MADFKEEEIAAKFDEFLSEPKYRHMIEDIANQYPEKRSIYVDYMEIEDYDMDLAESILKHPSKALSIANQVINDIMPPDKRAEGAELSLRVKTLLGKHRISKLRTSEVGRFVSIEGLVRRVTEVKPRIITGVYQCQRCTKTIEEPQDTWQPREPLECYKEQNGCMRSAASTKFKLLLDISPCVDSQKIEIQETAEAIIPGAQPERIACYAEKDITGLVTPGDRIIINGRLSSKQRSYPARTTMLDTYIAINSIETQERVYEEIVITAEDERKITELSKDPRCYTKIINSIVPTIYGMSYEKEAVALQLFGGVPKVMPDGSRLRGDIHILFIGDPGTAKSTILRAVSKIAPRGTYASGKTTSAVGLIAGVMKDEFGEGRWYLEAGAMALADRGHMCVDELDKMRSDDREAMHEAMAQQEVHIHKGDIHSMVQTRCPVLAAANPKHGRFDTAEYLAKQINIPVTLLSRFDLIFAVTDIPDPERDNQIAEHILEGERVGQVMARKLVGGSHEDMPESLTKFEPAVDPKFLRKYIAYAKGSIMPIMGEDVMDRIQKYYIGMRERTTEEDSAIAITPRQLQALVRLSEASARLALSSTVEVERDVDRAIRIMEYYLKKVASEDGRFDIDIVESGTSQSQRERIKTIHGIIRDLAAIEQPIDRDDIVREAEAYQISRGQTEAAIKRLLIEDGVIYEAGRGTGKYRLAR